MGNEKYYREKTITLMEKLFLDSNDVRNRFINCERYISDYVLASNLDSLPKDVKLEIDKMWLELNTEKDIETSKGELIRSSFESSVLKKRNKSLEKYLYLFLEEYYRVL